MSSQDKRRDLGHARSLQLLGLPSGPRLSVQPQAARETDLSHSGMAAHLGLLQRAKAFGGGAPSLRTRHASQREIPREATGSADPLALVNALLQRRLSAASLEADAGRPGTSPALPAEPREQPQPQAVAQAMAQLGPYGKYFPGAGRVAGPGAPPASTALFRAGQSLLTTGRHGSFTKDSPSLRALLGTQGNGAGPTQSADGLVGTEAGAANGHGKERGAGAASGNGDASGGAGTRNGAPGASSPSPGPPKGATKAAGAGPGPSLSGPTKAALAGHVYQMPAMAGPDAGPRPAGSVLPRSASQGPLTRGNSRVRPSSATLRKAPSGPSGVAGADSLPLQASTGDGRASARAGPAGGPVVPAAGAVVPTSRDTSGRSSAEPSGAAEAPAVAARQGARAAERSRAAGAESPWPGASSTQALIHVVDQASKREKEFECELATLTRHMRYFETYLEGVDLADQVEISVFCDVDVFEWLLRWAHEHSGEGLPQGTPPSLLTVSQSVSVLIAGHFLRMTELVNRALAFVCEHFLRVVFLPLDLTGLADDLTHYLQSHLAVDTLETAWVLSHAADEVARRMQAASGAAEPPGSQEVAEQGRRVRLAVNKLYRAKLQAMVAEEDGLLACCGVCGSVYATRHGPLLPCPRARMFVDFRGRVVTRHVADAAWTFARHMADLRQQRLSWRTVYWRTWGAMQAYWCRRCQQWFSLTHVGHCVHHPGQGLFGPGKNSGVYPCCGGQAARFGGGGAPGCCSQDHQWPDDLAGPPGAEGEPARAPDAATLDMFRRHRRLIELPFSSNGTGPGTAGAGSGQSGEDGKVAMSSFSVKAHVGASKPSAATPRARPGDGAAAPEVGRRFPQGYQRSPLSPTAPVWHTLTSAVLGNAAQRALLSLMNRARRPADCTDDPGSSADTSDSDAEPPRRSGSSSPVRGARDGAKGPTSHAPETARAAMDARPFRGLWPEAVPRSEMTVSREVLREDEASRIDAITHALVRARPSAAAKDAPGAPRRDRDRTRAPGAGIEVPATPLESTLGRSASEWGAALAQMAHDPLLQRPDKRAQYQVVLTGGQFVGHLASSDVSVRAAKYAIPLAAAPADSDASRPPSRPLTARSASQRRPPPRPASSAFGGAGNGTPRGPVHRASSERAPSSVERRASSRGNGGGAL